MLHDTNIELNKRKSRQCAATHKDLSLSKSLRKMRTRTLIQAGGLLKLSGLFEICGIEDGDDLQSDLEAMDKAATLLGILMEALPEDQELDQATLARCQETGTRKLKMHGARRRY